MQRWIWFTVILNILTVVYFFQAIKHKDSSKNKLIKRVYFSITLSLVALFYLGFMAYRSDYKVFSSWAIGTGLSLYVGALIGSLPILIDDIRRLFILVFRQFKKPSNPSENGISRSVFLKRSALALGGLFTSLLLNGMIRGRHNYQKHIVDVKWPRHEGKPPLKVVQISDFHLGSFTSSEPIQEIVDLINAEDPDLILFTGDLVNDFTDEALPYQDILVNLNARIGKFSVLGNHDYGDYAIKKDTPEGKQQWDENRANMLEFHKNIGFDLLLNENRTIQHQGESFNLVGVENWGAGRWTKYGDLEKALSATQPELPTILMSHDPSHWRAQIIPHQNPVDITLSGHTHGMQFGIEIPGFKWSLVQYKYPEWAGLYEKENQMIYVNRGVGYVGYPGRVGIMPEITVMTIS